MKSNVLFAYPYLQSPRLLQMIEEHADRVDVLVDSGAFTAWKAEKEIKLRDYMDFLERLPFTPWRYFALDVIGQPEATMKNYREMVRCGFKPIPVFTRGERPEVLEEYYNTSDVVGVGGLVGTKGNKGYVNGFMKLVGERKAHWLGFTNQRYVCHHKPYSCDSSSSEQGARFGNLKLYLGNNRWTGFARLKRKGHGGLLHKRVVLALRGFGIEPSELLSDDSWKGGRGVSRYCVIASQLAWARDVQRNIGPRIFAALTTALAFELLIKADQHVAEAA